MIVGLAVLMVTTAIYFYSERQRSYESEIISARVNQLGTMLIDNVRSIYNIGRDSRTVIELDFPKGVNNISVLGGREIVFNVHTNVGDSDMIYTCNFCGQATSYTINGTFSKEDVNIGKKYMRVRSCGKFIIIERVIFNTSREYQPPAGATSISC